MDAVPDDSAGESATVVTSSQSFAPEPPASEAPAAEPSAPGDLDEQFNDELGKMVERVKKLAPDYVAPPFSVKGAQAAISENLDRLTPEFGRPLLVKLRSTAGDFLDADTWRGVWYVVSYAAQSQADFIKRRMSGDYATDDWGFDREFLDAVQPFLTFLYRTYWRVEIPGMENVPESGRGLLVSNHSGQLPWDGVMVATAVYLEHPAQRLVRTLYASWFPTVPFFSTAFVKLGQTLATVDNGTRLLEEDQLVAVYPEGYKGVGKLFRERYQLARFGRGGFVKMALATQSPIIPVSVVGAEETYISLAKSRVVASLLGFPFFPITPTFPWLGPLGFIPIPTKWYIDFGEPIPMAEYGRDALDHLVLVSQLTDEVRNVVQQMIHQRLAQRRSVLLG